MPTQNKRTKSKKQSALRGLLHLGPTPKKYFLGVPIQFVQPLIVLIIIINFVSWTVWQYNRSHTPVITKIPAPTYSLNYPVAHTKIMAKSLPLHLRVPAAGVNTDIIQIGQNSDNTIELPTSYSIVGWYKFGPTPGELGPAIIVGHVDNYKGLAVFWYLKDLKQNDQIEVDRADGSEANFAVTKVEEVSQDNFPTSEVYGPINYAGIRLITCGGQFSHATGRYNHNIVVFGKLE